jgi:hypothetical protein
MDFICRSIFGGGGGKSSSASSGALDADVAGKLRASPVLQHEGIQRQLRALGCSQVSV